MRVSPKADLFRGQGNRSGLRTPVQWQPADLVLHPDQRWLQLQRPGQDRLGVVRARHVRNVHLRVRDDKTLGDVQRQMYTTSSKQSSSEAQVMQEISMRRGMSECGPRSTATARPSAARPARERSDSALLHDMTANAHITMS